MDLESLYQDILLDHYRKPRHRDRSLPRDAGVHHENPLCGDAITLRITVQDGTVADVAWTGDGCSISVASASMMSEAIQGLAVPEALALVERMRGLMHGDPPTEELGDLDALSGVARLAVRVKCALLPFMALKDALGRAGGEEVVP
jgi:nitrogen fixation protein NifU and related proteins